MAKSSLGEHSVTSATLPSGRCDTLITKDGEIVQFIMCTSKMDSKLGRSSKAGTNQAHNSTFMYKIIGVWAV